MPLIRTWAGEAIGYSPNIQYRKNGYIQPCSDMELNMLECFEAYGRTKGHYVCYDYLADFQECVAGRMQRRRADVMHTERVKQVIRGELKPSEIYGPKVSRISYIDGPLNP